MYTARAHAKTACKNALKRRPQRAVDEQAFLKWKETA